jgi:hypothetical protein
VRLLDLEVTSPSLPSIYLWGYVGLVERGSILFGVGIEDHSMK